MLGFGPLADAPLSAVKQSGPLSPSAAIAWAEDNDTCAIAGSVTGGTVSGSVAWTEANDTASLSGSVIASGTVAWTEANDTASLIGSVIASGSISWTEADDVTSISGTFGSGVFASVAWIEDADTSAIAGSVLNPVSGAINWTEANDTAILSGGVTASGAVAWTEQNDTTSISGSVISTITGALSWVEGDDVTNISGASFSAASGSVAWVEQDDVFAIYASAPIEGGAAPDYSVKKKYVVKVGDRLMVFSKQEDALNALPKDETKKQFPAKKGKQKPPEASIDAVAKIEPEETISLPEVKALAQAYDATDQYDALIQQRKYESLIALHQILIEREEEDIELLLLAM
jgi:hypothetical protein